MTTPAHDVVVRAQLEDELSRPLGVVRRELKGLSTDTERSGKSAVVTSREYDRLAAAVVRTANDAGRLSNALDRQTRSAHAVGGGLRQLATGYAAFSAATAGFRAVADLQDANTAFEGYLGNQRQALALTKQLQGLKSPFATSGLLSGAQSLLAFHTKAGDVVPTMQALSDAVAGTGGNTSKLTASAQAIGELRSSAFLTSGALSQLQQQGLPVVELLAKAHGVSADSLQRMLDSGALRITGQQAADELVSAMEERFKGKAAAAQNTLRGSLQHLGNSAAKTLSDSISPELPQITGFINSMAADLPGLAAAASPFLHVLGDTLGIMAAHPHLTEALGGFLLLRTAVEPAFGLARGLRDIAAGMVAVTAAQGGGGLARSVLMSTLGLNGGLRAAGGAATAETAAARSMYGAELGSLTLGAGRLPAVAAAPADAARLARARAAGARFGTRGVRALGAAGTVYAATELASSVLSPLAGGHDRLREGGQALLHIGEDAAMGAAIASAVPIPIISTGVGAVIGTGYGLYKEGGHLWHSIMGGGGDRAAAGGIDVGGVQVNIGSAMSAADVQQQALAALASPEALAKFQAAIDADRRAGRERQRTTS